jgi:hypothetical protein
VNYQTSLYNQRFKQPDYRFCKIKTGGFTKVERENLLDFLKENFGKIYIKIGEEKKYGRKFWYYRESK